jgi:O-antigen ligase
MIGQNFKETILPNAKSDSNVILVAGIISLGTCAVSVLLPSIPLKLSLLILGVAFVIMLRVHILQIILAAALLHTIAPDSYRPLADIIFGVAIALALLWIIIRISLGKERLQHSISSDILIACNILFALVGVLSTALNSMFGPVAVTEIGKIAIYIILILISYHLINDISMVRKLMWTFIWIGIALVTYYYYLAITLGPKAILVYGFTFLHSMSGVLGNPGAPSAVIADFIPFLIAFILFGTHRNKKKFVLAALFYVIIIWAMSNSRANYIFLYFALLALLAFHKRRKKYLTIFILLSISVFLTIKLIPLFQIFLRLDKGMTFREDFWKAAFRMIAESPLSGKGYGFFYKFKYSYMDPGIGRAMLGTSPDISVHNMLLMRGIDLGICGILIQLLYWIFPIVIFVKNEKSIRQSEYYYLYMAIAAIIVGMIARGFFDTGTNMPSPILLAALLKFPKLIKPPIPEIVAN